MPTQNGESPQPVRIVSDLESFSDMPSMAGSNYGMNSFSKPFSKVYAMSLKWDQGNVRGGGLVSTRWPRAQAQMKSPDEEEEEESGIIRPQSGSFVTAEDIMRFREQAKQKAEAAKRAREEDSPFSSSSSQPPPSKRRQTTHSAFTKTPTPGSSGSTAQDLDHLRAAARRATDSELDRRINELTESILRDSAREPKGKGKGKEIMVGESSPSSEAATEDSPGVDLGVFDLGMSRFNSKDPYLTDGPNKGDKVVAITMAEANRPYATYEDDMGTRISSRGALIPANYKLHDHHSRPFICPVRECRRIFANLQSLGGHFGAGHCASVFNDNGDGTLTKVGNYANVGPGGSPGLVVSRDPLPPDAPPPKTPSLSYTEVLKRGQNHSGETRPRPRWVIGSSAISSPAPVETPVPIPTPYALSPSAPLSSGSDIKTYLHSFLIPNQRTYKRMDVRHMLTLERKRNLPQSWILTHRGGDLDATHYACALAYLTGEEETGEKKCQASEREGRGPSARLADHCIRLPQSMPKSAQKLFCSLPSCVGCKYWSHSQRQDLKCDWQGVFALSSNSIVQGYMAKAQGGPPPAHLVIAVSSSSESDSSSDLGQGPDAGPSLETDPIPNFDSEPEEDLAFDSEPEPEPEPEHELEHQLEPELEPESEPKPEVESEPAPMTEYDEDSVIGARRTKRKVTAPASYALARARRDPIPKAPSTERASEDAPSKVPLKAPLEAPSDIPLEMEDWEVAPGRMTDASAQNIAYSNSYLTSGQPVTVSEDISFNVVVIKPGSSNHWDIEKSKLRTISVAAGKVKITMDDKTFNLGPNGMFVVSPGQSCKLENRVYVDSVLHCTTMSNF